MNILIRYNGYWGMGDLLCTDPLYDALYEKFGLDTKIWVEGEAGNVKYRPDYLGLPASDMTFDHIYDINTYKLMSMAEYAQLESMSSHIQHVCSYANVDVTGMRPKLYLTDDEVNTAQSYGVQDLEGIKVAICPDAFDSRRHLSIEKWDLIAKTLVRYGYQVIAVGAGGYIKKRGLKKYFQKKKMTCSLDLMGKPIRETVAALADVDLFVGSNSGLFQYVQAGDIPSLIIFSMHEPGRYIHPGGPEVYIYRSKGLPCLGCANRSFEYMAQAKCITDPYARCMEEISPLAVAQRIKAVIEERRSSK